MARAFGYAACAAIKGGMAALGREEGWRRGRRRISSKRLCNIDLLKRQGMSNRAIAHRLELTEKAIRKVVGASQPNASAQLPLAGIASEAPGEPSSTGAPSSTSAGDDVDRANSERTFDRQLAYLGLLDDAAPLFREESSVPAAGVPLALPCLVESGLLRISRKLYGEIGPAFYGLRTTLLTLRV